MVESSGCTCQGCGKKYTEDVSVPDKIWEKIKPFGKPEGAGLLCGQCIMNRVLEKLKAKNEKLKERVKELEDLWRSPNAESPERDVINTLNKAAWGCRDSLGEYGHGLYYSIMDVLKKASKVLGVDWKERIEPSGQTTRRTVEPLTDWDAGKK